MSSALTLKLKYQSKLTKDELPSGVIVCQRRARFSYQRHAVAHSPSVSALLSSLLFLNHALVTCYLSFSLHPPFLLPSPSPWRGMITTWLLAGVIFPISTMQWKGGAEWPSPAALCIVCSYCSWLLSSHPSPLTSEGHGCFHWLRSWLVHCTCVFCICVY